MLVPALSPGSNVVVDEVEDGSSVGRVSFGGGVVELVFPEEEPEPACEEPELPDVPEPLEEPTEEPVPLGEPVLLPAAGVVGAGRIRAGLRALVTVEP
jgi:hypothetical protein